MIKKMAACVLVVSLIAVTVYFSKPYFRESPMGPTKTISDTAAADPFGKYEHPVSIRLGYAVDPTGADLSGGETLEKNIWKTVIKQNLNIDVQVLWQVSKENLSQKIDLAIASNDLPDAMIVNQLQLNEMIKAGEIEDLTEAYNSSASPEIKKIIDSTNGLAMEQVTFAGKIMAVPSVTAEDFSMLWIRQDWLDRLGLKPPKTVDDLEAIAKAFVENDPDGNSKRDTIGLASSTGLYNDFNNSAFAFDLTPIFAAYGSFPGYWLSKEGKPVYGSVLQETKDALVKLREMYAKGLLDPELGIRNEAEETVINGQAGMFFQGFYAGYWPLPSAWQNEPEANWQAYALPLDANGAYPVKVDNPSSSFLVVRKGYAHPEAIIKINNLYLRDEFKYGTRFMLGRNFFAPADEARYESKAAQDILMGTKTPADFKDKSEYKLLENLVSTIKQTKLKPYDQYSISYWNEHSDSFMRGYSLLVGGRNFFDPNIHKVRSLTYIRTPTMEKAWAELSKLEHDTFLKIILGAEPIDSFDQFVEEWKEQGGDQVTVEVTVLHNHR
ncbi:Lipoprotein LipO [Paenibacillus polymyxa E681]|uniref:extracellular solute-binding protein n=1 Tax=Paenibacillus polymyxa TaxID=1406 RepID=UPI0002EF7528|nr:extracellular solute-binding protein [Paenibacillus polymyxa]ADM70216.2 sugar ABC transporter substrate-binding protein [Paenibacillus polymyxa E681]QNV57241.1 Lipoprotein LipO [Paenibacillus polymyxa E681]QNV62078.1 Lipoprotein LipO [Paenibacillus polymyxa E681]